jgi:hypothetical protein
MEGLDLLDRIGRQKTTRRESNPVRRLWIFSHNGPPNRRFGSPGASSRPLAASLCPFSAQKAARLMQKIHSLTVC